MKRDWLMIIVIEIIMLSFAIIATDIRQERHQTQNLPLLSDFQPQGEETYLIEGNALKWIGGNYIKTEVRAVVTGYSSDPDETDLNPYETASGTTVNPKTIACPRNIPFGSIVFVDGQERICEDVMSKKHPERFDLWFKNKESALDFGKQEKELTIYLLNL